MSKMSSKSSRIKIILPFPPSTNHLFPSANGRRFKSTKYTDWIKECEALWVGRKTYTLEWDKKGVIIKMTFYSKWLNLNGSVKKKDIDNFTKAILDFLPNIIVGFDDSMVWELNLKKMHSGREEVEIEVSETKRCISKL